MFDKPDLQAEREFWEKAIVSVQITLSACASGA